MSWASKQAKKLKKFYLFLLLLRSTSSINYRQIVTWKRKVQGDLRRFGCHICWTYRILIRTKKIYKEKDLYTDKNSKNKKTQKDFQIFTSNFYLSLSYFISFEYLWFFYTFFFYKNLEILVTFCYFFKHTKKRSRPIQDTFPSCNIKRVYLRNQFSWLFLLKFHVFHQVFWCFVETFFFDYIRNRCVVLISYFIFKYLEGRYKWQMPYVLDFSHIFSLLLVLFGLENGKMKKIRSFSLFYPFCWFENGR